MITEAEALKIIGKKKWDEFCRFMASDNPKITLDAQRVYDPERVSLFCRLRGIPVRTPTQGKKFNHLSRSVIAGPRKKTGRPKKTVEWDTTEEEENTAGVDEEKQM